MKYTFKTLVDAAVAAGEMDRGTADYFYGLYQDSADRKALGDLVDAVTVEFPGGMRDIGGKTGLALIAAVNALAKPPFDVAAVTEAQKHNHEKPLQLD